MSAIVLAHAAECEGRAWRHAHAAHETASALSSLESDLGAASTTLEDVMDEVGEWHAKEEMERVAAYAMAAKIEEGITEVGAAAERLSAAAPRLLAVAHPAADTTPSPPAACRHHSHHSLPSHPRGGSRDSGGSVGSFHSWLSPSIDDQLSGAWDGGAGGDAGDEPGCATAETAAASQATATPASQHDTPSFLEAAEQQLLRGTGGELLAMSTMRKMAAASPDARGGSLAAAGLQERPPWNKSTVPAAAGRRPAVARRAATTKELLTPPFQVGNRGGPPLRLMGPAALVVPAHAST